ncbi:MAG: 2-phosphosulfolactate phosphatase [Candidatus Bathyarchaeota archaeon]|nr:2-phosphosulfolactate phosphatase [Candidatus Bathyarchaeota archaeon]
MEVRRFSLLEGARRATGTAVIIDVFRAFTTAAFVMANGAEKILPVGGVEEALELRRRNPDWLVMGEVHGHKVPGYDYGNSPDEVSRVDFRGKTVIQRTSSGVQGILAASGADEILLGSFVIAEATVEYIKKKNPGVVSIVAMGWEGDFKAIEDELCAEYLEARLRGECPDFTDMARRIRADPQGAKFFDPAQTSFREGDFHAAMSLDRFPFALRVARGTPIRIEKA